MLRNYAEGQGTPMMPRLANVLTFLVTLALCASLLEFGYRAASGVPLFSFVDRREAHVVQSDLSAAVRYDPDVGYVLRPGIRSKGFNTIEPGVRANATPTEAPSISTGGILVVGNSFAAGSQVDDEETFPAQLETMTQRPVINAGVGGYGVDQSILRAAQLQPIVKPSVVVLDVQFDMVLVDSYSYYTRPKPYFVIENGLLQRKNRPVPDRDPEYEKHSALRDILAYSYVADQLLGRFLPEWWETGARSTFIKSGTDDVEVTCSIISEFHKELDRQGIQLIVLFQYDGLLIEASQQRPADLDLVRGCVRREAIPVADEWDRLREVAARDQLELKKYYVMSADGQSFGHMSPLGNKLVATVVSQALEAPPPAAIDINEPEAPLSEVRGDGTNLLSESAPLDRAILSTPHAVVTSSHVMPWSSPDYKLTARGAAGEHYVALPRPDILAGTYTFSLQAKANSVSHIRVQLFSEKHVGVMADFDLTNGKVMNLQRLDLRSEPRATVELSSDGWNHVSVSARLPDNGANILLQLLDERGQPNFSADGESLFIRKIKLERGNSVVSSSAPGVLR